MKEGKGNREEAIKPALEEKIKGKNTAHLLWQQGSDPRGRRQKEDKESGKGKERRSNRTRVYCVKAKKKRLDDEMQHGGREMERVEPCLNYIIKEVKMRLAYRDIHTYT